MQRSGRPPTLRCAAARLQWWPAIHWRLAAARPVRTAGSSEDRRAWEGSIRLHRPLTLGQRMGGREDSRSADWKADLVWTNLDPPDSNLVTLEAPGRAEASQPEPSSAGSEVPVATR